MDHHAEPLSAFLSKNFQCFRMSFAVMNDHREAEIPGQSNLLAQYRDLNVCPADDLRPVPVKLRHVEVGMGIDQHLVFSRNL